MIMLCSLNPRKTFHGAAAPTAMDTLSGAPTVCGHRCLGTPRGLRRCFDEEGVGPGVRLRRPLPSPP